MDKVSVPEITVFAKQHGILSKSLRLDHDGNLLKDSGGCRMVSGTASRRTLNDQDGPAAALARLLSTLQPNHAIGLGRLVEGIGQSIGIVTKEKEQPLPTGPVARTADNLVFAQGEPAFVLIDVDTKGAPPDVRDRLADEGIERLLTDVVPAIATTSRVLRASTSAGITVTATGQPIGDANGVHLYLMVSDGADIQRALKALAARLWLAGMGWIALSRSGAMLERCPADVAVGAPERLVFEGGPTLGKGLSQDQEARRPRWTAGAALDTRTALPDLTTEEELQYRRLVADAKSAIRGDAERVANDYQETEVDKLIKSGVTPEQAHDTIKNRSRGDLCSCDVIEFSDGRTTTVQEILENPKSFHGMSCADPVEGKEYGTTTACVYSDQAQPVINSFAHGGAIYRLTPADPDALALHLRIQAAAERIANQPKTTRASKAKEESEALGIGVRALNAEVKATLARQEHAKKAAKSERKVSDTRIDLQIHEDDYPKTAREVAALLAKDPDIFDRGGPVRLAHDQAKGGLTITPMTVESVINAVHYWAKPFVYIPGPEGLPPDKEYVTLPIQVARLYLDQKGKWKLRPLDGLSSSPLLRNDGSIVFGTGYDPESRMYCSNTPSVAISDQPTRQQALDALHRLRHHFRTFAFGDSQRVIDHDMDVDVVDLSKPPAGDESAALAALLTAVCRPSLDRAPALAVVAPSMSGAGTGKGLLVRTICAIATGSRPRAMTAGSDPQEFDKRITASLIGAEPVMFLDNLNGKSLQSDLLASAITENPAVVRTLGKSDQVLINPVTFIAITGNGLVLSEDLTRRFLTVTLDAGLEDPETRPFRGDMIQETMERRAELLSDVLTIWRWGRTNALPAGAAMGSFGRWCSWCRDPLLALGCVDPAQRAADAKRNDPRRRAIADLFNEWWNHHGAEPMRAADLAQSVKDVADPAGRGRQFLASYLRRLERTRLGGFILTRIDPDNKKAGDSYRLQKLDKDTPEDRKGKPQRERENEQLPPGVVAIFPWRRRV